MLNPSEAAKMQDYKFQSQLDSLKSLQNGNMPDDKLRKTAQDFEAVFVNKMLDIIDSTVDRQGGMFSAGKAAKQFKTFYHQAIAQEIASNPDTSFGLAKQMYEQLKDRL